MYMIINMEIIIFGKKQNKICQNYIILKDLIY